MTDAKSQGNIAAGENVEQAGGNAQAVIFDLYGTLADIEVDEESAGFWKRLAVDQFAQP